MKRLLPGGMKWNETQNIYGIVFGQPGRLLRDHANQARQVSFDCL